MDGMAKQKEERRTQGRSLGAGQGHSRTYPGRRSPYGERGQGTVLEFQERVTAQVGRS